MWLLCYQVQYLYRYYKVLYTIEFKEVSMAKHFDYIAIGGGSGGIASANPNSPAIENKHALTRPDPGISRYRLGNMQNIDNQPEGCK